MPPPTAADPPAARKGAHLVLPVRRRWLVLLLAVGVGLALASAVLQLAKGRGWEPPSLQLDRLLNADEDLSALNWLTASAFLVAALVAYAVSARQHADRLRWLAAAGVLASVSLDEAAGVHDPLSVSAEASLRAGGWRAAVVVLVAAVLGAVVIRFVLQLDPPVRWRVALALGLVLLAAIGVDAIGPDLVDDPAARLEADYVTKATLEEVLELAAAVLALDGMLAAALRR